MADIAACYVAIEVLRSTIAWWQSHVTKWRRPSQCKHQGREPRRPATVVDYNNDPILHCFRDIATYGSTCYISRGMGVKKV